MPFLYDWDFIFLFVLTLKFGARCRWKVILWFDWIQIAHFMNVSFTSGSGQTEVGRQVSPCLCPPWLWFPWRLEDGWLCINSEPRSRGCHGVGALTVRLSLSVCQCCAFSRSATVWLMLYCHPADTPKSCSGLLCSSTRGRSAEQTTQGKVVLTLLRI